MSRTAIFGVVAGTMALGLVLTAIGHWLLAIARRRADVERLHVARGHEASFRRRFRPSSRRAIRAVAYLLAAVSAIAYFASAIAFSSSADWVFKGVKATIGTDVLGAARVGAAWTFLGFVPVEAMLDALPRARPRLFWPLAAGLASVAAIRALSSIADRDASAVSLWLAAVPEGALVFLAFLLFDFLTGWYESLLGHDHDSMPTSSPGR